MQELGFGPLDISLNYYDDLEARIARLRAEEELSAVRPELNGNEIAEVLGIAPGPVLGRAYKHLLGVRLDRGPIGRDAVEAELRRWWSEQPEAGQGTPETPTGESASDAGSDAGSGTDRA